MIAKVMRGQDTPGLLQYLYGPGRVNEHTDPHLVVAWRPIGVPDPGRDPGAKISTLAERLDRFVRGQATKHVWHCAVRVAKTDRTLSDTEWAQVARRIAAAGGVAPQGDDRACRWVAIRHDGQESHHIHLVATLARQDDTNPSIHNDALHLRRECRLLESELGLRPTSASDNTSAPSPTRGETEKALRQGWSLTSRSRLERSARRAAAAARSERGFFDLLQGEGVLVRPRASRTGGPALGYALARPEDLTLEGQPVWFSGASLAPDLSLPRVRERFADAPHTAAPPHPGGAWIGLGEAIQDMADQWQDSSSGERAAAVAAISDALSALAATAPASMKGTLASAERTWSHAGRPPVQAFRTRAAARVREAARALGADVSPEGPLLRSAVLSPLLQMTSKTADWSAQNSWGPQERAARLVQLVLEEDLSQVRRS